MAYNKERILCAAIKSGDLIIPGYRHSDCYELLEALAPGSPKPERDAHGFLTSHKRFVDRKEGYIIAKDNDQLLLKPKLDDKDEILVSEDLYFQPDNYFGI